MKRERYSRRVNGELAVDVTAKVTLTKAEVAALRRGQARGHELRAFCESLLRDEIDRLIELDDEIQFEKNGGK